MNYKVFFFTVAGVIFLAAAFLLGRTIIDNSLAYRNFQEQYAYELNYEKRLLRADEYIMGTSAWEEKQAEAGRYRKLAEEKCLEAENGSMLMGGIEAGYVLLMFLGFAAWRERRQKLFIISLLLAALPLLYVGLFAPMLEIAAFELNLKIPIEIDTKIFGSLQLTKTFPGEMFFYYKSKSVIELIALLFESGNIVVAISILIFSVVIPLLKLVASLVLLLSSRLSNMTLLRFFAFAVSKWSMADVFVIATFLSYLSFNAMSTGIQTRSSSLPGLYFFLGYCLVSLMAAFLCKRYIDQQNQVDAGV